MKSLKYAQTEHEHLQIYFSYKVHTNRHTSYILCAYVCVCVFVIFLELCKRDSNLIYALHRRNETKRFHISHTSLTFSFVSYEEAAAAGMAGHGSRRACVLLFCILITKWFDSRAGGVCVWRSVFVRVSLFSICKSLRLSWAQKCSYILPINIYFIKPRQNTWHVLKNASSFV